MHASTLMTRMMHMQNTQKNSHTHEATGMGSCRRLSLKQIATIKSTNTHTRTHTRTHAHIHTQAHICIRARTHTHTHTRTHAHAHAHAHTRARTHTRAHTHARTHTHTHTLSVSYSVSYTHTHITPIHPHVLHDLFGAMQIVLASGVQAPHPKCVCVCSKFKMCVCVCVRVCVMQIARANGGLRRWNKWWRPSSAKRVTTIWCSGIKVRVCRGDGEGGLNTLDWFSCVIESCLATCA